MKTILQDMKSFWPKEEQEQIKADHTKTKQKF